MMIPLEVNGKHHEVDVSPEVPLLWVTVVVGKSVMG